MIAVTGGAGFIGSVLVSELNKWGERDILIADTLGSGSKFLNLRAKMYSQIMHPDVFLTRLRAGLVKPWAIVHLGAITDTDEEDADLLLSRNAHYSRMLAEIAIDQGIRFIYASSATVYGDGKQGCTDADDVTGSLMPLSAYAFSKWSFDVDVVRSQWSSKVAGLRLFNVFGPNEYHKGKMGSAVWHAWRQAHVNRAVQLFESDRPDYPDGTQSRDFVYVKDVAAVILWLLENRNICGIFNVGTGTASTFNEMAAAVFSTLNKRCAIEYVSPPKPMKSSYQYYTQAVLDKLRAAGCRHEFLPLDQAVLDFVCRHLESDNLYV